MADDRSPLDPDDWWAGVAAEDDAGEPAPPLEPPRGLRLPARSRLYSGVVAVAAVALLVAGLFAGGVFDNGSSPTATPPTSPPPTTGATAGTTTTRTRPTIAVPSGALAPGASGAQVKLLQRALVRLGYKPGAVDGSYGPATVAAVKLLQRAAGLTEDGVLGPKTLAALRAALRSVR